MRRETERGPRVHDDDLPATSMPVTGICDDWMRAPCVICVTRAGETGAGARPESALRAFHALCKEIPEAGLEEFLHVYETVVRRLREMSTVIGHTRPDKSRELHPFLQRKFPEVRRDNIRESFGPCENVGSVHRHRAAILGLPRTSLETMPTETNKKFLRPRALARAAGSGAGTPAHQSNGALHGRS